MDGDSQVAFKAEKKREHEPSAFAKTTVPVVLRKIDKDPSIIEIARKDVGPNISKYIFGEYEGASPLAASVHAGIKGKIAPEAVAEKLAHQLGQNVQHLIPQEKRA